MSKEDITDKLEEVVPKANDWFADHNVSSRLIILVFLAIFVYSFVAPLPFVYAELSAWLLFIVFTLISVGINSLKIVSELILKLKGK